MAVGCRFVRGSPCVIFFLVVLPTNVILARAERTLALQDPSSIELLVPLVAACMDQHDVFSEKPKSTVYVRTDKFYLLDYFTICRLCNWVLRVDVEYFGLEVLTIFTSMSADSLDSATIFDALSVSLTKSARVRLSRPHRLSGQGPQHTQMLTHGLVGSYLGWCPSPACCRAYG